MTIIPLLTDSYKNINDFELNKSHGWSCKENRTEILGSLHVAH